MPKVQSPLNGQYQGAARPRTRLQRSGDVATPYYAHARHATSPMLPRLRAAVPKAGGAWVGPSSTDNELMVSSLKGLLDVIGS